MVSAHRIVLECCCYQPFSKLGSIAVVSD